MSVSDELMLKVGVIAGDFCAQHLQLRAGAAVCLTQEFGTVRLASVSEVTE